MNYRNPVYTALCYNANLICCDGLWYAHAYDIGHVTREAAALAYLMPKTLIVNDDIRKTFPSKGFRLIRAGLITPRMDAPNIREDVPVMCGTEGFVPQTYPPPCDLETEQDKERLAMAEAKRLRKAK